METIVLLKEIERATVVDAQTCRNGDFNLVYVVDYRMGQTGYHRFVYYAGLDKWAEYVDIQHEWFAADESDYRYNEYKSVEEVADRIAGLNDDCTSVIKHNEEEVCTEIERIYTMLAEMLKDGYRYGNNWDEEDDED